LIVVCAREMSPLSVAQETSVPAGERRSCRRAHPTDGVRVGLLGFGLYQVAVGLLLAIDPGAFLMPLGPAETAGDHYVRELAAFELPLGLALLAALRLRSWRVPTLALATAHWALHAMSHLVDLGTTAPLWLGAVDLAALWIGAALLAWLLARAVRAERWESA
jgi:hypothetical protein